MVFFVSADAAAAAKKSKGKGSGRVGPCASGKYKGERCLIAGTKDRPGKFPITKGGKPSPGRIRNANVRASQFGYPGVIKRNTPYVKKHTKGTSKFLSANK